MDNIIKNRYDFSLLLEVENGNPNGDPAMNNRPRMDVQTGKGIITDSCFKRKVRDFTLNYADSEGYQEGFDVYVREGIPLQRHEKIAFEKMGIYIDEAKVKDVIKNKKTDDADLEIKMRDVMCRKFYDIRTFGGVMTSFTKYGLNCGQIQGPVQFCFAQSIDAIEVEKITITRVTVTSESEAKEKIRTMGEKYIVPYGLYRMNGFISPCIAQKVTGFTEKDLEWLWKCLTKMYDVHHTASTGRIAVRKLVVFKHDSALGLSPSHELFNRLSVQRKKGVEFARKYEDYEVNLDMKNLPEGIEVISLI